MQCNQQTHHVSKDTMFCGCYSACMCTTQHWQGQRTPPPNDHHHVTLRQPGHCAEATNVTWCQNNTTRQMWESFAASQSLYRMWLLHNIYRAWGNSSKRLLKDHPTHADQQIPNETTAVGPTVHPHNTHLQACLEETDPSRHGGLHGCLGDLRRVAPPGATNEQCYVMVARWQW